MKDPFDPSKSGNSKLGAVIVSRLLRAFICNMYTLFDPSRENNTNLVLGIHKIPVGDDLVDNFELFHDVVSQIVNPLSIVWRSQEEHVENSSCKVDPDTSNKA